MPGDTRVNAYLLELYRAKLTAQAQYVQDAAQREQWGFGGLAKRAHAVANTQKVHAEMLRNQLGLHHPAPQALVPLPVSEARDIKDQYQIHLRLSSQCVDLLNSALQTATTAGDRPSADLFASIRNDEEEHVDWLETQLYLIGELGFDSYCAGQAQDDEADNGSEA